MYLEDVDLAWRAQRAGWRCRYVPEARVLHHTSASAGRQSAFKYRLLGRNKIWMAVKQAEWHNWPVILVYDTLGCVYALITRGERSHLRGRIDALGALRAILRDRDTRGNTRLRYAPLVAPWRVPARFG